MNTKSNIIFGTGDNEILENTANLSTDKHGAPVTVITPSNVWVCGSSPVGIAGSNLAGGMDVSLSLQGVVRLESLC